MTDRRDTYDERPFDGDDRETPPQTPLAIGQSIMLLRESAKSQGTTLLSIWEHVKATDVNVSDMRAEVAEARKLLLTRHDSRPNWISAAALVAIALLLVAARCA